MNLTKSLITGLGYSLIGLIYVCLFTILLYIFSINRLYNDHIISIQPFLNFQKFYYQEYYRNVWQYSKDCVETDESLIYKPKIGTCKFENIEFSTILRFDEYGRFHQNRHLLTNKNNGIAVIGDSFSMGWGVDDNETFSYLLQKEIRRPVYNLGVSSYATEREILRLINSDLFSKVDVIIIQYCENDLNENKFLGNNERFSTEQKKYINLLNAHNFEREKWQSRPYYSTLESMVRLTNKIRSRFIDETKTEYSHTYYLEKILKKYKDQLKNKKIVVFYLNDHKNIFHDWEKNTKDSILFVDYQKKLGSDDYYTLDGHLNSKGHAKISKYIIETINKN